jgi:hypothetical protein
MKNKQKYWHPAIKPLKKMNGKVVVAVFLHTTFFFKKNFASCRKFAVKVG